MRQLIVIAEMGSGGAESIVTQLAHDGAARGDDLTVATAGGWRVADLERQGVAVVTLPLREPGPRSLVRSVRVLRRWLARHGPVDVVHTHNVRATVAARLALPFGRVGRRPPVVATVHGLAERRYGLAARSLALSADEVVAVSEDAAARLRAGGFPSERLHLVPNAPAPLERVDRAQARASLQLDPDVPVVLCLARLVPPKRQDLLIEAWADPAGEVPASAVLLVAGGGDRREALETQARSTGLGDRIRFLGDRRDVDVLLSAADVLVLPSDQEGLPVVVLEAMSLGLPVVASRVGGLAALDDEALVLVTPGSAAALAAGVARLLIDPVAAREVGERGAALVASTYSGPVMAQRYRTLLAQSVSRRRR